LSSNKRREIPIFSFYAAIDEKRFALPASRTFDVLRHRQPRLS
jgi:hypothetical protein